MSALIDSNDSYKEVTVMRVDWDEYRGTPFSKELNIRRQSTLVMFKEGEEIGRLIAQTSSNAIEELFIAATSS